MSADIGVDRKDAPRRSDPHVLTSSFLRRLTIGLTLIVGMSSALVVALFTINALRTEVGEIDRNVTASSAEIAQLLEAPLWDLDIDRAVRIAEGFSRDPRVAQLTIRDFTGGETRTITRAPTTDVVTSTHAVRHLGKDIGSVTVAFSRGVYSARVWRQVAIAVVVSLISLMATLIGGRILVRRLLKRPLAELSELVAAYGHGQYTRRGLPERYTEFQPLVGVLNAMGERILSQITDLRAANERLSREAEVRQQAEDVALTNRNMLALVIDTVPQAIFWKDRASVYLGCNMVFARTVGMQHPSDVVGLTDFDLPWDRGMVAGYHATDQEVLDQGRVRRNIVERFEKDGVTTWVNTTKLPLVDDSGRVFGLLGIAEDVTERRAAEYELRGRNEELAALNRFLRVAATEVELAPMLTEASRELVEILGVPHVTALVFDELGSTATVYAEYPLSVADSIGERVELHGDDFRVRALREPGRPIALPALAEHPTAAGNALGLPFVVQGETIGGLVITSSVSPHVFAADDIAFASSIAAQSSTALARHRASVAERLLRAAIEQLPEKVLITDIEGRIEYVNPAFTAVTGFSHEEALGNTPRLLKSGVHPDDVYVGMWAKLVAGETWYGQLSNRKKNGEIFFENAIITPVRDARGDIVHYVAVGRDITRDLERDEQLRHAQRLEAVGQLAGGVAHDFNNIIGAVVMQLELLELDDDLPEDITGGINEIRSAVDRAANLTRQLLLFSRRQAMSVQPHDLNVVMANLLRMLTRVIGESITISFVPAIVPAFINADSGMIEQVVMNLCVNARDSMPSGGRLDVSVKCVTVDAHSEPGASNGMAGYYACLSVRDSGIGMSLETQRRIFEPFFTTKDVGKGTGLGLATSHGIVAQHGGWIDVTSELGHGSEFRVYLPALEGKPAASRTSAPTSIERGSELILLVEDEDLLRAMVSRMLRKLGYEVLEASNGPEAIRIFEQETRRIDLLLTDMVMPQGISGTDLGLRLRERRPDLEVLIMSGYSVELTGEGGTLPIGMRFLSKPFTTKLLSDAVQQALAAIRGSRAST